MILGTTLTNLIVVTMPTKQTSNLARDMVMVYRQFSAFWRFLADSTNLTLPSQDIGIVSRGYTVPVLEQYPALVGSPLCSPTSQMDQVFVGRQVRTFNAFERHKLIVRSILLFVFSLFFISKLLEYIAI